MHKIVVDLGFGDAGKGTTVDWLCSLGGVEATVFFNGGAQRAHNVVMPDGRHHTFAQWGSGTFRGVPTIHSCDTMVNPLNMAHEARALKAAGIKDPWSMVSVDPDALITTPYHIMWNRYDERVRGHARHGSTGQGIGATARHALDHPDEAVRFSDLDSPWRLDEKLVRLRARTIDRCGSDAAIELEELVERYLGVGRRVAPFLGPYTTGEFVWEGSQGVLLDEWWGFHPHTTWSTCTPENALHRIGSAESQVLGVLRTYTTRHGDGPMPTEARSHGFASLHPERHNGHGTWMGGWRAGPFDAVLSRYAVRCCEQIDGLVITHADHQTEPLVTAHKGQGGTISMHHLIPKNKHDLAFRERTTEFLKTCRPERYDGAATPEAISDVLGVPLFAVSTGPTAGDKKAMVTT